MSDFILAIDQGTTGTTAVLVDAKDLSFVDKVNQEYAQIYPKPSWVEHNLDDIWGTVETTVTEVLERNNVESKQIACIGITNQRETICPFDKEGKALGHALVWQDRRTTQYCEQLAKEHGKSIQQKTGLPVDPYFSGTKIKWLLDNNEQVQKAAASGNLRLGNIDTFLLYRLSGGTSFATETSNASRTLLMNLEKCEWDDELLDLLQVKKEFLPEIKESFGEFGKTKGLSFLADGIPITGILGDQQAALFGQAALTPGEMKCTYGTGAFLLLNVGEKVKRSEAGLLSTAYYSYGGKNYYALEGSCYIAGAAVQWCRDNLKVVATSPEIEKLASSVTNLEEMEHIMFLPFFAGLASPHWKPEGKAAIVGLTRDSGKAHIARACLEGVALSINDIISTMRTDAGVDIKLLKVDGGMCANDLFLDLQAAASEVDIIRPRVIETTAYGAALGAAIGVGLMNIQDVEKYWQEDRQFSVNSSLKDYFGNKKQQWSKLVKALYY